MGIYEHMERRGPTPREIREMQRNTVSHPQPVMTTFSSMLYLRRDEDFPTAEQMVRGGQIAYTKHVLLTSAGLTPGQMLLTARTVD